MLHETLTDPSLNPLFIGERLSTSRLNRVEPFRFEVSIPSSSGNVCRPTPRQPQLALRSSLNPLFIGERLSTTA